MCNDSSDPLVLGLGLTDRLLVGVVTSSGGEWLTEWAGGQLVLGGEHLLEERWSVPNGVPEGEREGQSKVKS